MAITYGDAECFEDAHLDGEDDEEPRCDHCGKPERFNVLCPECEQLACECCGRVVCCCAAEPYPNDEVTAVDDKTQCRACRAWVRYRDAYGYCINCKNDAAANGGEGDDEMEQHDPDDTGFAQPLHTYPPNGLVSMRNAIDLELKSRRDALARELAATEHALAGTKPRARRSDAGRPREKKVEAA